MSFHCVALSWMVELAGIEPASAPYFMRLSSYSCEIGAILKNLPNTTAHRLFVIFSYQLRLVLVRVSFYCQICVSPAALPADVARQHCRA